ncbi:MAG: PA0069 family radical SAM protein [Alphaproteobacteria bacterium]
MEIAPDRRRGRGAQSNRSGRFEPEQRVAFDDGWDSRDDLERIGTRVQIEKPRRIISRNTSPDLSFDRSINPYRGCEHGCVYCFARPTHAYMGLSPGLDFESRLFAKPDAARLLEAELSAPGYRPRMIAIGTNTDPYQPIERHHKIMRDVLSVLARTRHPVGIVTKSSLILRDLDLLKALAADSLVTVAISLTTLDRKLARTMEPRASTPSKRLAALEALANAGIPASAMIAPIVPGLTDMELERLLEAAASAGVTRAGYILIRLPLEVAPIFKEWLLAHYPDRYNKIMAQIQATRGGKDYDAAWGQRMRGEGPVATLIKRRFELACKRLGLGDRYRPLRTDLFRRPQGAQGQLSLF